MKKYPAGLIIIICIIQMAAGQGPSGREVSRRFMRLTRNSKWTPAESLRLKFNTHHPQGMVKIGDFFYLSSVEVTQPTRRYPEPRDGFDRDTGAGRGHLFKFDHNGNLLEDLPLGEGSIYHPGGTDYDGRFIWVPVAEYRPASRSIVYRVDPRTMKAIEVFRYPDHIGGIVHDTESRSLHGVSWGSRYFYRWKLDGRSLVTNAAVPPEKLRRANRSFYIDYQDCKFLGRGQMLCTGLSNYRSAGGRFSLGGIEIVDLTTDRAIHQIPLELWTESGLPMTQNPFWIEPAGRGLRAWFIPEDRQSTMYVFEVDAVF